MNLSTLNKQINTAVKAVIYSEDGKLLMQQRDLLPGLPFAGHWNFFGGLAEIDEPVREALHRELIEELGCIPGNIGEELFQWRWESEWAATDNHFFPLRSNDEVKDLDLREGRDLQWLSLEELVSMPLTPAVYENFFDLATLLKRFDPAVVEKLESMLLSVNELRKKNDRVFYAWRNPCGLSRQQMFLLKALASLKDVPVFRICLHTDDQADVHEMIMIHTKPSSVGPLKQNKTSLSYHMIAGSLSIDLHDEQGNVLSEYSASNMPAHHTGVMSLRLNASQYRTVKTSSSFAIFIEVGSGPFQDNDTFWLK